MTLWPILWENRSHRIDKMGMKTWSLGAHSGSLNKTLVARTRNLGASGDRAPVRQQPWAYTCLSCWKHRLVSLICQAGIVLWSFHNLKTYRFATIYVKLIRKLFKFIKFCTGMIDSDSQVELWSSPVQHHHLIFKFWVTCCLDLSTSNAFILLLYGWIRFLHATSNLSYNIKSPQIYNYLCNFQQR